MRKIVKSDTQKLDKNKIFYILKQNKHQLLKYSVKKIGLFGSFIKGKPNKESDIDFLVEFEEGKKNFNNFIHLAYFLEDLLGREVELLTIDSLSPYMKPKILKEVQFESFS